MVAFVVAGCSSSSTENESDLSDGTAVPTTAAEAVAAEAPAETTAETTTTTVAPTEAIAADADFFEDFSSAGSMARFETGLFHRDDHLIADAQWPADHQITGPNDQCGPPDEKRTVERGDREAGFNTDWVYRCVPGGDLEKAHMMTSIGDTSGYSIGAATPAVAFASAREVRWDVNLTDLGNRQFVEVKLIPEENFDFGQLPCALPLPCHTPEVGELDAVAVSFSAQQMYIHNGTELFRSDVDWSRRYPSDPALSSIAIRRTMVFRDNQDGTLTYEIEREDGSFESFTRPGSFPEGPLRVVFADHNYTPLKDGPVIGFTWHWDNIEVLQGTGAAS